MIGLGIYFYNYFIIICICEIFAYFVARHGNL